MTQSFVVAGAALLICGGAQAQSHFTFTEQLGDSGPLMTGTFDGMLSGDVITSLSNISVFMDGVAFQGNGSLIAMHYDQDQYLYVLGGAIASLDGQHNNFLFADVDPNLGGIPIIMRACSTRRAVGTRPMRSAGSAIRSGVMVRSGSGRPSWRCRSRRAGC